MSPPLAPLRLVRRGAAWLWWYLTELTGENAYQRYVERARTASDAPPLSRAEFERRRTDARATEPGGGGRGCC